MKHLDFSDNPKTSRREDRRTARRGGCVRCLMVLLTCGLVASCVKHEEISFSGSVVGIRNCEMTYTDLNAGYIVQLETPTDIGGMLVSDDAEDTLYNLIVLYEAPRVIQVGKRLHGKFYVDNKYSKANSCVTWNNQYIENLPEGVFTEVVVD